MIPAIINHLWQSTLFAALAGLLTLALRHNAAWVRYRLWLAASAKFLFPFSLLVTAGEHIRWRTAPAAPGSPFVPLVAGPFQPFPAAASVPGPVPAMRLEFVLAAIWIVGVTIVVWHWYARWRRLQIALAGASPLPIEAPVPVLSSPHLREPGVFGIFRAALLLPDGITARLAPGEWQTILAHELCHVRRRDNLTAALHMAVEAVFWFHPLVWWLGTRLGAERERACDEEVLQSSRDPEAYAAGILKVCRFYVESPLPCAAGVTGANLKKRIEAIMNYRPAKTLSTARKLALAAAGAAAMITPVAIGILNAPPLRAQTPAAQRLAFEVASIKENKSDDPRGSGLQFLPGGRFIARKMPLIVLVGVAYNVPPQSSRLAGGPDWIRQQRYDIEATAEAGAIPDGASDKVRTERLRSMLQTLLAERFHMNIRRETRDLPIYAIGVAKSGPKLQKAAVEEKDCAEKPKGPDDPAACHIFRGGQGQGLHGQAVSLSDLISGVEGFADRPVVDQTGLKGLFNIQTEGWVPMRPRPPRPPGQEPSAEDLAFADPARPTIFQIFDRLGLKLEPSRAPIDVFVIAGAEHPTEN